jgi:hypothetical protein
MSSNICLGDDPLWAQFTGDEEMIVFSSPIDSAPSGAIYEVAAKLNLPHGVYNIKFASTHDCVLKIGQDRDTQVDQFLAPASAVVETQISIAGDPLRYTCEIENYSSGFDLGFVFVIYDAEKIVYATKATDWLYTVDEDLLDVDLQEPPDARLALPVFHFRPNWKNGILEGLQYLTNPIVSESGTMQTSSLRISPRRYFEYEFLKSGGEQRRLNSFFSGVGYDKFMFPLWHEQFRPLLGVPDDSLFCELPEDEAALREFRIGDLVLVTYGHEDEYEILKIDDISADTLVWTTEPTFDWGPGARIVPLRIGRFESQMARSAITDDVVSSQVRLIVAEHEDAVVEEWPDGEALWPYSPNWSQAIEFGNERITSTFDNETSLPFLRDMSGLDSVTMRSSFLFKSRSSVFALKKFISAARGSARLFLADSAVTDLKQTGTVLSFQIRVEAVGLYEYFKKQPNTKLTLKIRTRDGGAPIYRQVVSVDQELDTAPPNRPTVEILGLDASVGTSGANIDKISFMIPSRFAQDTFELKHHGDNSGFVSATFVMKSWSDQFEAPGGGGGGGGGGIPI